MLGTHTDVTQLKLAEEALMDSNTELREFACVVSHDLLAPLRHIAGFAQSLQEDYQGRLDDNADNYIKRIVDGTSSMQKLINGLLEYSQADARVMVREKICLNSIVDKAKELLSTSIKNTKCSISRDDLPTVSYENSQISQLMQNLIANGIKYRNDQPPEIHVAAERQDSGWVISVRDNGLGIDPQYHKKIFNIFYRLHSHKQYSGTGIGLAICHRIVQRHGGRIWVESELGSGSTFYFTIPTEHKNDT